MGEPPPGSGRANALEAALKNDQIIRAVWSIGGVAKRLTAFLADHVFTSLTASAITATTIDTATLDATGAVTADSIDVVDLTVTGTATLPGGGGVTYAVSGSAQALNTNGDTITIPADTTVVRVTSSGGITGILIGAGANGQLLVVSNESNNTFQYDATVIAGVAAFTHAANQDLYLIYRTSDSKWHRQMT